MPGIVVGIDGSGHSQLALEWAIKEAAVRHASLTVLTVHQVPVGYFGNPVEYPGDRALTQQMQTTAQEETDKVLAEFGDSRPAAVTVKAVSGFPVEELIGASADADMIVLGSRGAGGFTHLLMGSVSSQVTYHAHCPVVIVPPADRT
jgi:nucleotide-binding universal stress UspA family protein